MGNFKPLAGRADLLRALHRLRQSGGGTEQSEAAVAATLGYRYEPPPPKKPDDETDPSTETKPPPIKPSTGNYRMMFWQPWEIKYIEEPDIIRQQNSFEAAYEHARHNPPAMPSDPPPVVAPLSRWNRLGPMLKQSVTSELPGRKLDVPALVRCWSRGSYLQKIPRKPRRTWGRIVVLVDQPIRLVPFWSDQIFLLCELYRYLGPQNVDLKLLDSGPEHPASGRGKPLLSPDKRGLPILALSDLGFAGGQDERDAWLRLGHQLRRAGESLQALVPLPKSRWDDEVAQVWGAMPWERPAGNEAETHEQREQQVGELLARLAPCLRIEPGLLRTVRQSLPRSQADAGTEFDFWNHSALATRYPGGSPLRQDVVEKWRAKFWELPEQERSKVLLAIKRWHWQRERKPEFWHMELLMLKASAVAHPSPEKLQAVEREFAQELGDASKFIKILAGAWNVHKQQVPDEAVQWFNYVEERLPDKAFAMGDTGQALQRIRTEIRKLDRRSRLPEGDATVVDTSEQPPTSREFELHQVGGELLVGEKGLQVAMFQREQLWGVSVVHRSPVGYIHAARRQLIPVGAGVMSQPLELGKKAKVSAAPTSMLELRTDRATLKLRPIAVHPKGTKQGWGTAMGRDKYGLWVEFTVGEPAVTHRMRWIPPGRFWMGSPGGEQGRWEDEAPRHEVILTHGYWLGESPITQELWVALMKANPSRFQSPTRPVERVSWDDSCKFIEVLNKRIATSDGQAFTLPSEAQWEYACRAGTTTATYAGDFEILGQHNAPLLNEIAWYGGNSGESYELEEGVDSSGWEGKQYPHTKAGAHPVKQKRANAWGLYDMLGNVDEWCFDTWGPYDLAMQENPIAMHGDEGSRVFRGGAFDASAGGCRAAYRSAFPRDFRWRGRGFRLCRGQPAAEQGTGK